MPNLYVWKATLFATMSTFLSGYYDGSMNGILEMNGFHTAFSHLYGSDSLPESDGNNNDSLKNTSMQEEDQVCSSRNGASADIIIGLAVSISNLSSVVGSLFAGWLSDQFSRKYGLLLSGVVIAVGSIILATSFYMWAFILGRGISGIGIGIIFMVMPVYISEMSPKESRGMLVSFSGIGYAIGILLSSCTNFGFSRFLLGWRVAMVIQACIGLFYALGMLLWMPHTPRWLIAKQRDLEALFVLTSINHHSRKETSVDTHIEFEELKASVKSTTFRYRDILRTSFKRKYTTRFFLTVTLFFLFSIIGNFVYFYVATLFCQVGIVPFIAALAVGLIILIASLILPLFVDKVGRKISLLCSSLANIISAVIVATLLLVFGSTNAVVTYIVVAVICVYSFSISTTWLTIPWIINCEVFPVNIRGLTVGGSAGFYWLFTFVTNQVTPLILGSPLGVHGFFYILTGANIFAFFFVLFTLPETKGIGLERMDELFSQSYLRRVGLGSCERSTPSVSKDTEEDPYQKDDEIKEQDSYIIN